MMEIAKVSKVHGDKVSLICQASACENCSAKGFCSVDVKEYEAYNKKQLILKVDDVVEIYLPEGRTIFASFITLIFPLLMFIAAFFFAVTLLGIQNELIAALFGFLGLAAGFFGSLLYSRHKPLTKLPIITRKMDEEL